MYLVKQFLKSNISPTDRLFQVVSDYDIYCELTGEELSMGRPISSPIRDDDRTPSFSLYVPTRLNDVRPEEIWWTDFTRGSGNVFDFVKLFAEYRFGEILKTRREIVEFIDKQLDLGLFAGKIDTRPKRYIDYDHERKSKSILFKSRDFTKSDLKWWSMYGINDMMLKEHNVRSLKYLLNDDYTIKYTYRESELGFVYVVYDKVKIYSPYGGDFKWRNTCPSHYILGEEQLKGHPYLIITKSLKDIMTFKSFMNVDAIAPQSETSGLTREKLDKIKETYEMVFVVMDYDSAGISAANTLATEGFHIRWVDTNPLIINNKPTIIDKDISDYAKNNGLDMVPKKLRDMFPELPDSAFKATTL